MKERADPNKKQGFMTRAHTSNNATSRDPNEVPGEKSRPRGMNQLKGWASGCDAHVYEVS